MTAAFSAHLDRKYRAAVSMEAWRVWVADEADLVAFAAQADLAPSRAASDTSATLLGHAAHRFARSADIWDDSRPWITAVFFRRFRIQVIYPIRTASPRRLQARAMRSTWPAAGSSAGTPQSRMTCGSATWTG
jgi:hypothetical protein